ncbi:MAG: hypothetical protein US63_C0009G0002 [Candidatus Moranbacteria bacterium GW2011_GWC2_37_8]|nr:MAG: hypothetical protein US63_C0009G0002 [Candidatus Moranbacteria bacterium GW2011_GWC2_37_8]KKQ81008.1 MAG: hypothetical protein UT03_C0014G0003 [Candidatus Moranbacteria bacterium GW2011_GWD2_38_7]
MREQETQNTQVKTASGINALAGLWLMLSSYFMGLGFTSNEFIVGIIVAVVSLVGWYSIEQAPWVSWVNGILGVWMLVTPIFVTGMTAAVLWNSIILGVVILTMAIWAGMSSSSTMGHGQGHGHPRMR